MINTCLPILWHEQNTPTEWWAVQLLLGFFCGIVNSNVQLFDFCGTFPIFILSNVHVKIHWSIWKSVLLQQRSESAQKDSPANSWQQNTQHYKNCWRHFLLTFYLLFAILLWAFCFVWSNLDQTLNGYFRTVAPLWTPLTTCDFHSTRAYI